MKKITIAFDVDGTLIQAKEGQIIPNERIRSMLIAFASFKNTKIIVWSGSGALWANQVVNAIGIKKYVDAIYSKSDTIDKPDIAIDDVQACEMGMLNLIVKEK